MMVLRYRKLEIPYLAGFFDGEGCIMITKNTSNRSRKGFIYQLVVVIANKDQKILEEIKNVLKGGSTRSFRHNENTYYEYNVVARQAERALKMGKPQTSDEEWAFQEEIYKRMRMLKKAGRYDH